MVRKIIEKSSVYPYHVYNRTTDKVFYPLNAQDLWSEACDLLRIITWAYGARIHAFVLMSNHYHLLLTTPDENLSDCMRYFQSELSRWVKEQTKKELYCFSNRYKWTIIKDHSHYALALKYVYQNPLRAKIVENLREYPWSTFANLIGESSLGCPLATSDWSLHVPEDLSDLEEWLSCVPPNVENEKVRRALSKRNFKIPKKLNNSWKNV